MIEQTATLTNSLQQGITIARMGTRKKTTRRRYNRRSDDERIAELEERIRNLQAKAVMREKKADPVIKEIPKVQRRLTKFAQLALDNGRQDIANSITAFNAGLERILRSETEKALRNSTAPSKEA